MQIALPVAQYHPGHPSDYAARALRRLGYQASIAPVANLNEVQQHYDLFLCIDSGLPIDLSMPSPSPILSRTAFWFIDYRHNKERPERTPNDITNCHILEESGGWIFQAQYEDYEDCIRRGIRRCSFLPLAADCEIWSDSPQKQKEFDVGFAGNVWDQARLDALRSIKAAGLSLAYRGAGKIWLKEAAELLRSSKIAFNISSFFGTSVSFDVNMRVFESLSCGVPLVTNWVPSITRIFGESMPFIRCYKNLFELVPLLKQSLEEDCFLSSGPSAREWIENNATYDHRMRNAMDILAASKIIA